MHRFVGIVSFHVSKLQFMMKSLDFFYLVLAGFCFLQYNRRDFSTKNLYAFVFSIRDTFFSYCIILQ